MDQQKQIQFLKPLLKSKNKIAKHLGINRETVSKYWEETIPTGVLSAERQIGVRISIGNILKKKLAPGFFYDCGDELLIYF